MLNGAATPATPGSYYRVKEVVGVLSDVGRGGKRMTVTRDALPCCLDFEASGLGSGSYPIEAGWSPRSAGHENAGPRCRPCGRLFEKRAE